MHARVQDNIYTVIWRIDQSLYSLNFINKLLFAFRKNNKNNLK